MTITFKTSEFSSFLSQKSESIFLKYLKGEETQGFDKILSIYQYTKYYKNFILSNFNIASYVLSPALGLIFGKVMWIKRTIIQKFIPSDW